MKQSKNAELILNRHCEKCGKVLSVSQNKFCSRECMRLSPEFVRKRFCNCVSRSKLPSLDKRVRAKGGDIE
jgi:hypothetical protein